MPGTQFSKALLDRQADQISDEYNRMVNIASEDLKLILKACAVEIPRKLFKLADLRSFKSSFSIL